MTSTPPTTPQRHQEEARQAFRDITTNAAQNRSPRRRLPGPRPETPTPQPGNAERARALTRDRVREANVADLQASPRRRRTHGVHDENQPSNSPHLQVNAPPPALCTPPPTAPPQTTTTTAVRQQNSVHHRRSLGQQVRRARERAEREAARLAASTIPAPVQGVPPQHTTPAPSAVAAHQHGSPAPNRLPTSLQIGRHPIALQPQTTVSPSTLTRTANSQAPPAPFPTPIIDRCRLTAPRAPVVQLFTPPATQAPVSHATVVQPRGRGRPRAMPAPTPMLTLGMQSEGRGRTALAMRTVVNPPLIQAAPTSRQGPAPTQAAPRRQTRCTTDLFLAARRPYQEPVGRHDLGPMNVECRYCKAKHWMAEKKANSSQTSPEFGSLCCADGDVSLPLLRDPPQALKDLFEGNNAQADEFRKNVYAYNRAFAFTSMKVRQDYCVNHRGPRREAPADDSNPHDESDHGGDDGEDGSRRRRHRGLPPVFRIQGELFHRGGALTRVEKPTYAQLYIYDPQAALEHRCNNNRARNANTLSILQDLLLEHHQYAAIYMHAYEILQGYNPEDDVSIRLRMTPGNDPRRYNLPTADEVAVILPQTGNPNETSPRDIILHSRNGPLQTISDIHPAYIPLYYVLLFPHGENGWHPQLRRCGVDGERTRKLTQLAYVAYRIQVRSSEYSALLRGGRLFQRYVVDMFATIDQSRVNYLRHEQAKIRATLYSGLEDAVAQGDENVDLHDLGQRTVLPSSYIGGPRHMHQRYQDSMAIARFFRIVDLFLTVTCNPEWAEILRELLPHQTAYDRPDLVARVFQLKKKAILEYIYKHGIFGHAVAYVYTIEYQKRGLPHMHCLIFLKEPHKLTTTDAIDSCIRAYWPDPETEPLLFETVKQCMVHGPCGAANPNAPCMENGKCKKGFPKPFAEFTTMDEHGFPVYHRPDDGRAYTVRGFEADNRWIVPYPALLCALFNCHINIECAATLGSFKYLFKYIQKGPDMGTLEISERDEISKYMNGRYISAPEAAMRIFRFETHDQVPNVVRLQVHLPGQHMVVFDPDEDPESIIERASQERTTLTAYFEANAHPGALGEEARKYTYQEFPQHFSWKADKKKWVLRTRDYQFAIGRMYYVPPTAGERFYLRTLLTVVKGAKSFEDLRQYSREDPHLTFYAACVARGLLEDDGEWRLCLEEASTMQTGRKLRELFATILLFCSPAQPDILWNEFRAHICDDLHYRLRGLGISNPSEEEVYDYGLHLLNNLLKESGHSLYDWPSMPQPQRNWDRYRINRLITEQLDYNQGEQLQYWRDNLPLLNNGQKDAYNHIVESVNTNNGRIFMLSGPGGTGKTFVYKVICSKLRGEGSIVLCVASSGIAALLLPGGRTAHSMFKIPVDGLGSDSYCSIPKDSDRAELLRNTKCIIWDEIVPQHRNAIEAFDRTLRDVRSCPDRPFGGITVLFGGDFQQTLPVVNKGSRAEIVDATLTSSYLWSSVNALYLTENMRLRHDPDGQEFAQWLLNVGHGRNMVSDTKVSIPQNMCVPGIDDLINFVYPSVNTSPPPPPEYFLHRMILAPRNMDVEDVNNTILGLMHGEEVFLYSADEVIHEEGADSPHHAMPLTAEFLRSIRASSLPPGELRLKVGCPIILLRNLSPSNGLCNGTRAIVTRISSRVLEVRVIGGDHDGNIALIPRISLTPTSINDISFRIRRRQFPVRLAFAMSINKAQGQSVKIVGLDMRLPVFSHGQLCVALSRATSKDKVRILLPHDNTDFTTVNVVYDEVLLD